MAIVAGVDFGTLSARVAIVDSERGRLGSAVSEYPLHRTKDDPDHATQSHADHMRALIESMQEALPVANVSGDQIASVALHGPRL
jgi:L-ribulokinase